MSNVVARVKGDSSLRFTHCGLSIGGKQIGGLRRMIRGQGPAEIEISFIDEQRAAAQLGLRRQVSKHCCGTRATRVVQNSIERVAGHNEGSGEMQWRFFLLEL